MAEIIIQTDSITTIIQEQEDSVFVVEEIENVTIVEMEPGVPGPQGPPAPLSATLVLYPTTAESDVPGYFHLVTDVSNADYDNPAVDVPTGAIGSETLLSSLVSDAGLIVGSPGVVNLTIVGNIRKVTGATSTNATFHFHLYKRNALGVEESIGVSDNTRTVINAEYEEFSASLLFNDGEWTETDRIVLKFYGEKVGGGVDPTYEFQFGGETPVRVIIPVPVSVLLSNYYTKQETEDLAIAYSIALG